MDYDKKLPFLEHFRELRKRLILSITVLVLGWIAAFLFYDRYTALLLQPYHEAGLEMKTDEILEAFSTRLKLSLYMGIIFSLPVHIYNCVAFVSPALKASERRFVFGLLSGSLLLIVSGGYMAYFQVMPLAIDFLADTDWLPAEVDQYFNFTRSLLFTFQLLLAFVILFQFPLFLLILLKMNVLQRNQLLAKSRYVVIGIFVLAAMATPPDVISQIALAVPLICLFYLTILIAKLCRLGEP